LAAIEGAAGGPCPKLLALLAHLLSQAREEKKFGKGGCEKL
jgi:hypothetical protein